MAALTIIGVLIAICLIVRWAWDSGYDHACRQGRFEDLTRTGQIMDNVNSTVEDVRFWIKRALR